MQEPLVSHVLCTIVICKPILLDAYEILNLKILIFLFFPLIIYRDKIAAITAAKACRPIIDPISHLNILLDKFQTARESFKFAPRSFSLQKSFNISHASNRQTSMLKSSSMSEGDQDYETSISSSVNTRNAGIRKASSSALILPLIAPSRIPTQEKKLGLGITSYNSAAAARVRRSRASFS